MMTFLVFDDPGPGTAEWIIAQTGVGARESAGVQQYMANIVDHDALHRRYAYCHENPVRGWLARHAGLVAGVTIFLICALLVFNLVYPGYINTKDPFVFWVCIVSMFLLVWGPTSFSKFLFKPYVYAERGWEKEEVQEYYSPEFTELCKAQKMKLYRHTHPFLLNKPLFSIVGEGDSGMEVEYFLCSSPRS